MEQQMAQAQSLVAGQMLFVLVLAALLTLPVSLAVLSLYKRRVLRSMASRGGAAWPSVVLAGTVSGIGATARSASGAGPVLLDAGQTAGQDAGKAAGYNPETESLLATALRQPWRAAAVYAVGGLAAVCVVTVSQLASGGLEFGALRFVFVGWVLAWPIVLTLCLVAAATPRTRLTAVVAYFVGLCAIGVVGLRMSPDLTVLQVVGLWLLMNVVPTLLLLASLNRRVRAVGPLMLTFLVVTLAGPTLALAALGSSESVLRIVANFGFSLGLGAFGVLLAVVFATILTFGVPGWLLLTWLGRAYERKRISDQSITVDALWVLVCAAGAAFMSNNAVVWLLTAPLAFVVYKLVVTIGFAVAHPRAAKGDGGTPRRLALLRVFALGKRSERLFDALDTHWRHLGSVQLITGPDLATSTIEPHELLDFLRGRFARRFITEPRVLEQRMLEMDLRPDRDWRYRVNDFFCTDESWRTVLARLVAECDVVLMDLRDFTVRRAGCAWEIKALVNAVPLGRIVLLVDATTDEAYLHEVVREGWKEMSADSPNAIDATPGIRLFRFTGLGSGTLRALLRELSAAATATGAAVAAPSSAIGSRNPPLVSPVA